MKALSNRDKQLRKLELDDVFELLMEADTVIKNMVLYMRTHGSINQKKSTPYKNMVAFRKRMV